MTYINHITLNSGHSRQSARSEVRDVVIPDMQALIDQALVGTAPIEQCPGYYTMASTADKSLSMTVLHGDVPLVTFSVVKSSRGGTAAWEALHTTATAGQTPVVTRPDQPPDAPWLGVVVWPSSLRDPSASMWLGDFERCIAWAWLEKTGD